jgi:hypothetical protein
MFVAPHLGRKPGITRSIDARKRFGQQPRLKSHRGSLAGGAQRHPPALTAHRRPALPMSERRYEPWTDGD